MPAGLELLEMIDASDVHRFRFRAGKSGQEHSRENGNDRNDHQQFN